MFEHFNPHFITTVVFEPRGEETRVDWSLLCDTEEMREIVIRAHKADEGQKDNLGKLEEYLSKLYSELKQAGYSVFAQNHAEVQLSIS